MSADASQRATIQGSHNIVVQVEGSGRARVVVAERNKPQLYLTPFDGPRQLDTRAPWKDAPTATRTGLDEISLLIPASRSFRLVGREAVVDRLRHWLYDARDVGGCDDISIQVLIGEGGSGKTRLALELCDEVNKRKGWLAGFIPEGELGKYLNHSVADWGWDTHVFAVVDSAATQREALHRWFKDLYQHTNAADGATKYKLRILLLERYGGIKYCWWKTVFGEGSDRQIDRYLRDDTAPLSLGPIEAPEDRCAIFAEAYRLAAGRELPRINGLDEIIRKQCAGGKPLLIAMLGLREARREAGDLPEHLDTELVMTLAEQEIKRIRDVWKDAKFTDNEFRRVRVPDHLASVATACGGLVDADSEAVLAEELEALKFDCNARDASEVLRQALPGCGDRNIAGISPDLIGEAAMVYTWESLKDAGSTTVARLHQHSTYREQVTQMVARTCRDFAADGYEAPRKWLDIITAKSSDVDSLIDIAARLPDAPPHVLDAALATGREAFSAAQAQYLADKSNDNALRYVAAIEVYAHKLFMVRDYEKALDVIETGLAIAAGHDVFRAYRGPIAYLHYVRAISCESLRQFEVAAAAIAEAIATAQSDDSLLPLMFDAKAVILHDIGDNEAALAAVDKAITLIGSDLARGRERDPDAIRAKCLYTQAVVFSSLHRHDKALLAIELCKCLYDKLVLSDVVQYAAEHLRALVNYCRCLDNLGRTKEALCFVEEYETIARAYHKRYPKLYAELLGEILLNKGVYLYSSGDVEHATTAAEKAVALFRGLVCETSERYVQQLIVATGNNAVYLSCLGKFDDALKLNEEAYKLAREWFGRRPAVYRPTFADAINNQAYRLMELRRFDEACPLAKEAVKLGRELVADNPESYGIDLSNYLDTLGRALAPFDATSAAAAFEEAVNLRLGAYAKYHDANCKTMEMTYHAYGELCRKHPEELRQRYIDFFTGVPKELGPETPEFNGDQRWVRIS